MSLCTEFLRHSIYGPATQRIIWSSFVCSFVPRFDANTNVCVCVFDIYAFCLRINMIAHTPAALGSGCSSTSNDNTNEFFGEECVRNRASAFCVHQNETNNMAKSHESRMKKHTHTRAKIINRIFNAVARAPKRIFSQLFIIGGTHTNSTLETSAIRIWISCSPPCRVCMRKILCCHSMVCECERMGVVFSAWIHLSPA